MDFIKYPSLINGYAVVRKSIYRKEVLSSQWYSTEKIHGSNIVIGVDLGTGEVNYGGRNGFRTDYPYSEIPIILERKGNTLIEELKHLVGYEVLYVYGELFGAGIQKMRYTANEENTRDIRIFNVLGLKGNDLYVISRKKLDEVISPDYLTLIVEIDTAESLLGSELKTSSEYGGNCEGFVYQPYLDEDYLMRYDETLGNYSGFLGIKDKHQSFSEVKIQENPTTTVRELEIINTVNSYVTENRIKNILSHGIELTEKNFGTIIKEVQKDITVEIERDENITLEEMKSTVNKIGKDVVYILKNMMKNGLE